MRDYAQRRRWSDNDRYLGPFTYSRDRSYRSIAIEASSGEEEYPGASVRISGFGHTFIAGIPNWLLRPDRRWQDTSQYHWAKPPFGYWNITRRVYGFSYFEGHLSFHYGRQTMDSSTDMQKGFFIPWAQWRFVRHSFYGLDGDHVATLPDTGKSYRDDPDRFRREQEIADATPSVAFDFEDFDDERISATTRIEEREWRFGTKWLKWLSLFRKPKIQRSLDIRFSNETGRRKGSWKGGTVGHSIEMRSGELHESAFRRYCAEHEMTFISVRPLS